MRDSESGRSAQRGMKVAPELAAMAGPVALMAEPQGLDRVGRDPGARQVRPELAGGPDGEVPPGKPPGPLTQGPDASITRQLADQPERPPPMGGQDARELGGPSQRTRPVINRQERTLLDEHESLVSQRPTGIDDRVVRDFDREVGRQSHFTDSTQAEMLGVLDVHLEVVRYSMLSQKVIESNRGHGDLSMPVSAPRRAGQIQGAPFRVFLVDPELDLACLTRHGHISDRQPAIANGFRKTGADLLAEGVVGLDGHHPEAALEVEPRIVPVVHSHVEDEILSGRDIHRLEAVPRNRCRGKPQVSTGPCRTRF